MTTDYADKLRSMAKSHADPAMRREAARRLHERGEAVEGGLMRDVLRRKIDASTARTEHYREKEAQDDDKLTPAFHDAFDDPSSPASRIFPAIAIGKALGERPATVAFGGGLMSRMAATGTSLPPEPERAPVPVPLPDEPAEYPALDALIAKYRAEAQQPAHDPVVVETVAQSSVADKLAVARAADRVKQIERVEKLRTKRPKRRDYITTYDPITGEPQ